MNEFEQAAIEAESLYHPLSQANQEIRLLEVLPTLNNGRVECRLSTEYLRSADYVVLSYRWGVLAAEHEIVINERSFHVRRNLWDFLNVVRHQSGMLFWIDALCINQNDIEERNQQVGIMGHIFQSASMVLSWLGSANPDVERAFDLMSAVWSRPHTEDDSDQLPVLDSDQSEEDLWRCIAELCTFPYWNRVWVVQEILLSTNNYLLCGQKTLPWQVFANFIALIDVRFVCPPAYSRIIRDSTARSYAVSKPYVMVSEELQWRVGNALKHDFGKAWNVREFNLFRILSMYGDRDCTDPLDHVYALLSLTDEGSIFPIRYGIGQTDLFLSLIHFCGRSAAPEGETAKPLIFDQHSQRAFIRNSKHIAEILETTVVAQRTQPYYYGSSVDMRNPSPRPNPCFPSSDQSVIIQCNSILPGNEPPILRSNTLRRSISTIPFNQLFHITESSSWLMCQQSSNYPRRCQIVGAITIKDSPQGRGFRILEPGSIQSALLTTSYNGGLDEPWNLHITPDMHLDFLKIVVLGQQPG